MQVEMEYMWGPNEKTQTSKITQLIFTDILSK